MKNYFKPRDYQWDVLSSVIDGFDNYDRGNVYLACGVGKSMVSFWVDELLKSKKTLVLVPSLILVSQIEKTWRQQSKRNRRHIKVCSSERIDKNSIKDINDFVVFATYQSSHIVAELFPDGFDFIVFDEAHRSASYDGSKFSLAHINENIYGKKRLYMTATPKIDEDCPDGFVSYSMDNESIFGKTFHSISFSEAISKGILCDYRVVILCRKNDQRMIDHRKEKMSIESIVDIYLKSKDEYGIRKSIMFNSRVKDAEKVCEMVRQKGVDAFCINGSQSIDERDKILKRFERTKKPALITNVNCLSEGIDIPAVDGVYIMCKKESRIQVGQILGRGLRKSPEKDITKIIIPFIDNTKEEFIKSSSQGVFIGRYSGILKILMFVKEGVRDLIHNVSVVIRDGDNEIPNILARHNPGECMFSTYGLDIRDDYHITYDHLDRYEVTGEEEMLDPSAKVIGDAEKEKKFHKNGSDAVERALSGSYRGNKKTQFTLNKK